MTTIFVLLLIAGAVFVIIRKLNQPTTPLVGSLKKVEVAVAKVGEVAVNVLDVNNDGKVNLSDAAAVATAVVKKVRKPRAKKSVSKKKN